VVVSYATTGSTGPTRDRAVAGQRQPGHGPGPPPAAELDCRGRRRPLDRRGRGRGAGAKPCGGRPRPRPGRRGAPASSQLDQSMRRAGREACQRSASSCRG
jgi:hypothetical protein